MPEHGFRKAAGWAVHLFTALGAVCGLLALDAIADGQARLAFIWMFVAVAIDAVDGFLARTARVENVTPGYDGALLDNLVDYLNYAVVPAFVVLRLAVVLPDLSGYVAAAILLASAYQFAQREAKTADHYFLGFPSYWNVAVFYCYFLNLSPYRTTAVIAVLVILTFVPQKWIYPTRMSQLQGITLFLASLWGASIGYVLITVPTPIPVAWGSLLFVGYYVAVSLYLSRKDAAPT